MNIGQIMAGYDLGSSDVRIRKTLGKKKVKLIPEIRSEFITGKLLDGKKSPYCIGAIARGYNEKVAGDIFKSMEDFAKYAFNKSHSGCYAVVGYKTMWAKTHYTAEWALACLRKQDNDDLVKSTISDAQRMGVKILPPDINKSGTLFTMEHYRNDDLNPKKALRFGMSNIKAVGEKAVDFIIHERKKNGDFKDLLDFYTRMHSYNKKELEDLGMKSNPINKRIEEHLIKAGCFDFQSKNRYSMLNMYYMKVYTGKLKDPYEPLKTDSFKQMVKLEWENELLGMYVSEHPLSQFEYENFEAAEDGEEITTTGLLVDGEVKKTKGGKDFSKIVIEDMTGQKIYCMLFGRTHEDFMGRLFDAELSPKKKTIVNVTGEVNKTFRNLNVKRLKVGKIRKKVSNKKKEQIEQFVPAILDDPDDM